MAGIWSKHRWQIWHTQQHPYKHPISEFSYTNSVMPGVTDLESAMDWILAVIYQMSQNTVATVADLPVAGTVTFSVASPGIVSRTAHGFSSGDQVVFTTTGTLPAALTAGTNYFVKKCYCE